MGFDQTTDRLRRGHLGADFFSLEDRIAGLEAENRDLRERLERLERSLEGLGDVLNVRPGGRLEINATSIEANCAMSNFTGVVRCHSIVATTVVGSSYTPGAGNIW